MFDREEKKKMGMISKHMNQIQNDEDAYLSLMSTVDIAGEHNVVFVSNLSKTKFN